MLIAAIAIAVTISHVLLVQALLEARQHAVRLQEKLDVSANQA